MSVSDAVLAAMRETNEVFDAQVVRNRDFGALDRVYTLDARILPPGANAVEGRSQIKSFWQQAIMGLGVASARLSTISAEPLGDCVFEIGRADLGLASGQTVTAKYVVLWKQEDGQWKWHVDIWNMNQ